MVRSTVVRYDDGLTSIRYTLWALTAVYISQQITDDNESVPHSPVGHDYQQTSLRTHMLTLQSKANAQRIGF